MEIREPQFDRRNGFGITWIRGQPHDPFTAPIDAGASLQLGYQGMRMDVQVETVEEFVDGVGARFIGTVLAFDMCELEHAGLGSGERIRFHRDDIRWIFQ